MGNYKKKKQVSEYSVPLVIFLNIILFVFHFLFNLSVCVSLPLSSPSVQLNSNIHHWHGCHYYVAKAIKYITIWDCVCVCVLGVCTCISHQSWSSLPNPFPESTTDSFEVNLESAVWLKAYRGDVCYSVHDVWYDHDWSHLWRYLDPAELDRLVFLAVFFLVFFCFVQFMCL